MSNVIGDVVKVSPLNKKFLDTFVFKSLNGCEYISEETKGFLLSYSDDNGESFNNAKKLWKNLLIDAICILKINDSREKLYKDCGENKLFNQDNFKLVRKVSSYGINEIEGYFDDFVDFEKALYGSDQHYRDHVDHVLQVWAIGISLIDHNEFVLSDGYLLNKSKTFHYDISEFKVDEEDRLILDANGNRIFNDDKVRSISKSEFWAMWTIAALCHDLGYPIEKTSNINKQAKKIINHFGNMNFSELNYSFDIFNTFLVDKFLNVISSKAIFSSTENVTMIQTKYRDKFSKTLEDNKHGIFSSLLIYKNLTYFLETDYFVSQSKLEPEDLRQFYIRKEILRSISCHTCPKLYRINLNTLSFLLILCDELQEWNRPNFEELRFNMEGNTPEIELKEFDMNGKQKIHIHFNYLRPVTGNDKKHLVNGKFKTIHYLLRSAKDDRNRKIDFKWEVFFPDERFFFLFDSNKNSFELLTVSHQKFDESTSTFKDLVTYPLYN